MSTSKYLLKNVDLTENKLYVQKVNMDNDPMTNQNGIEWQRKQNHKMTEEMVQGGNA